MAYEYHATASRFEATISREGRSSSNHVEVNLHVSTLTVEKGGETLLEADISELEELSDSLSN